MRVLCAIDSFKGCLSSAEANAAAREGILAVRPDAEVLTLPVSDGGEGWLEAYRAATGGQVVQTIACDPLLRPIPTTYVISGTTAVIEVAQVIGLTLLTPDERRPLEASSYGVGQLITDALGRGCTRFIIGLGGSATSDAGRGMLRALTDAFGTTAAPWHRLHVTIATDVRNPLCGPEGAAAVFAPQKGATPAVVEALESRARHFARLSARRMGFDRSGHPGAGAAGGLGYAFIQYLGATCCPGADLLLDAFRFDDLLADAALVVTGEGSADRQTLMGKLPERILRRCCSHGARAVLLAGRIDDRPALIQAGFADVLCINPPGLSPQEALRREVAMDNISYTLSCYLRHTLS